MLKVALLAVLPLFAFSSTQVPQYTTYEKELISNSLPSGNPFYFNVTVRVTTSASGSRRSFMEFPCYYDGATSWRFRFEPDVQGEWKWEIFSEVSDLDGMSGSVECVKNTDGSHGGLVTDSSYPHAFFYEDGTPYFLLGYEADWLWALDLEPDTSYLNLESFIKEITSYGYNHILLNIYAKEAGWSKNVPRPPRVSPTEKIPWNVTSNGDIDYDHFDIDYWKHYDQVLRLLNKYGAIAHIMIMVYNKGVAWPKQESKQDNLYWSYVISRYQGFPNVIFDLSKEANREPDSCWQNRFPYVVSLDAHKRLHTAHTKCTPVEYCDFFALQQHSNSNSPAHDLYNALVGQLESANKPAANVEFQYENGPIPTYGHNSTAAEMKLVIWSLYMTGGYAAWYYEDTAWDVITNDTTPGYSYCQNLKSFWTSMPTYKYSRCNNMITHYSGGQSGFCLGKSGDTYLFYFPAHVDSFDVNIGDDKNYSGEWIDTSNIGKTPLNQNVHKGSNTFKPPSSEGDVFLYLH